MSKIASIPSNTTSGDLIRVINDRLRSIDLALGSVSSTSSSSSSTSSGGSSSGGSTGSVDEVQVSY